MPAFSSYVAGALLGGSLIAGNKQRKATKRAGQAQAAINRIVNKQTKRDFLRQFREAQANNLLGGIASLGGGYESSRIQGGASSLQTQRTVGLKEFDQQAALGEQVIARNIDAARYGFASSVLRTGVQFAMSDAGASWINKLGKKSGPVPTVNTWDVNKDNLTDGWKG